MKTFRILTSLLLATSLSFGLVACGEDDEDNYPYGRDSVPTGIDDYDHVPGAGETYEECLYNSQAAGDLSLQEAARCDGLL